MKGVVRTIVFDWDRTFLDSVPAGYNASVTVLRHFGIEVDRKRFLETYSPNWYDSYRMLGVSRGRVAPRRPAVARNLSPADVRALSIRHHNAPTDGHSRDLLRLAGNGDSLRQPSCMGLK
jgi:phosphoglycolate phosphatase-like HAD superfamily hydrolase